MKLNSHYVEKPWGRTDLPPLFEGANGRRIGEVWFDAVDRQLPILVKWLFTSEKLSIQVHPDNDQAQKHGLPSGKEECWIIVSAESGAKLGMGTIRPLTKEELRAASLSGEIEQLMEWRTVSAGDYFYIPAGTVHAIGAGITLVEVQQNTDITYRLFDYGRPRELHLDDGVAVSNAKPYSEKQLGSIGKTRLQVLVSGPYFNLWHARGDAIGELAEQSGAMWIIPLQGSVSVNGAIAAAGECLYLEGREGVTADAMAAALVAMECPSGSGTQE